MKPFNFFTYTLLLFASSIHAEVITLAAESSWPPFAKKDGSGISKTIIEKAYSYSGHTVEFVVVPYARALSMAKQGSVDGAFNVTKQASTEADFSFGERALLKVSASFYYPPGSNLSYTTSDMIPRGTSIATIIGYEYGDRYEKNRERFDEVRVATQAQIVNLLKAGRVDMAIMFDEVASYTLEQMQLPTEDIKKGHINHTSDIYVAFNKSHANSQIVKDLDKGLKAIEQESAYITP